MNILFLSYWEADDGLSKATVVPHLKILKEIKGVCEVVYCSIERSNRMVEPIDLGNGIIHVPLYTGKRYLDKILDFIFIPKKLGRLVKERNIDMMVCRGSPAGSLGHLVNRKYGTPYVVESFEPHALYMAEAGVWSARGLKYRYQKRWESAQLQSAQRVVTVSNQYKDFLIRGGAKTDKVFTVACAVDIGKFSFDEARRAEMRQQLGVTDQSIVGIYAGKFGGLYYDNEAFEVFSKAFECIQEFRLIILTPDNLEKVRKKLGGVGITAKYYLGFVGHDVVPHYLSAADFAFALYKPSPSARFLSPVKVGEYWANGLPVLLTEGVGDDSAIIREEGGGVTFSFEDDGSVIGAFKSIEKMIRENPRLKLSERIAKLALKYRNFERVREVYNSIFLGR